MLYDFVVCGISMHAEPVNTGWRIDMRIDERDEMRFVNLPHNCGLGMVKARAKRVIDYSEYMRIEGITYA